MKTAVSKIEALMEPSLRLPARRAEFAIPSQVQWRMLIYMLVINDILMIGLGFLVAYLFRFQLELPIFQLDVRPSIGFYQRLVSILIPVWLAIFAFYGLYNRQKLLGGTQEYSKLFNATATGMLLVIAAGFLLPDFIFARGWLLLSWTFAFLFTGMGRFTLRRVVYALRHRGYFLSPAVIVGTNEEGESLAAQLMRWKTSGLRLVGFVDDHTAVGSRILPHLSVLGKLDDLDDIVRQHSIEEIIITSSALTRERMITIFQRYGTCPELNVRMSSGLYEIITTGLQVKEFAYVPLVGINKVRMTGMDRILKLILDYSLAIPGVIIALPVFALIGLAIKLDSPGPVFHRRRVMGVNGRQFDAFKFRTMYINGDEILEKRPELKAELAREHKLKDDPRVTRVGALLRKTSLDELPQAFNVLRGEMSVVGPRMISPPEMNMYKQWSQNLLTVKPGITGVWQVSGRSDVTYQERVRLDMYYIRNWSIWLDLQLLLQTIPAVLFRRGAY